MVLELASLEKKKKKKKERKKEDDDFRFFSKFVFSACIKLSGNQRSYLYSGGSGLSIDINFVDIELSYDVLSPLPIVLSNYCNHHICTTSDKVRMRQMFHVKHGVDVPPLHVCDRKGSEIDASPSYRYQRVFSR